MGKAIFDINLQQSIKKKKSSQREPVPNKSTATHEEKGKKEATKKAEAEKRRNAEIAAKISQATKRISSQHKQKDYNRQPVAVELLQEDNVHPVSLPAFRKQKRSTDDPAST